MVVILFTRCMTIAMTNARVYDDLRHLGASNAFLRLQLATYYYNHHRTHSHACSR